MEALQASFARHVAGKKTPYTSGHVGVSSVLMTLAAWWKVRQEQ
jgi:hypothetical protein